VEYISFTIFDQYLAVCDKRHKMGPELQWNGNGKSYAHYQTVTFLMTLSDLWRSFQSFIISDI